jgi:quercetin dioxygenase-like cupin family protein
MPDSPDPWPQPPLAPSAATAGRPSRAAEHGPAALNPVVWPAELAPPDLSVIAPMLVGPSPLLRFCPRGCRRRVIVRGPDSLVSVLAFEAGQREHVHQHRDSGEYFHDVLGSGKLLIADTWRSLSPGTTYFRPPGAWHAVAASSRLLLISIQVPVPARSETIWLEPPERLALRSEDRESLARHRCCRCPCCGGHLRRQRPAAACANCGSPRAPARCENCGWTVRALCLPAGQPRAS